jgi:hypothetical protein
MASFRRYLKPKGFAEIWPLYNAAMGPRQVAMAAKSAVFLHATPRIARASLKGQSPAETAGGRRIIVNLRA